MTTGDQQKGSAMIEPTQCKHYVRNRQVEEICSVNTTPEGNNLIK